MRVRTYWIKKYIFNSQARGDEHVNLRAPFYCYSLFFLFNYIYCKTVAHYFVYIWLGALCIYWYISVNYYIFYLLSKIRSYLPAEFVWQGTKRKKINLIITLFMNAILRKNFLDSIWGCISDMDLWDYLFIYAITYFQLIYIIMIIINTNQLTTKKGLDGYK